MTRNDIWQNLDQPWDIIVVGGGITGAGILREGVRLGLKVLLVEQNDFAYGTSSKSSKLVHGGLRYLKEGKIGLTWASVQERERLQQAAPGLVEPLGFLYAMFKGDKQWRERWMMEAGLSLYDMLAVQWSHRHYNPREVWLLAPHLDNQQLAGAFQYSDAQTDDVRLVLRVLREAVAAGGTAVNYASVRQLIREGEQVVGVVVRDEVSGRELTLHSRVVINATGAWVDGLRQMVGAEAKMRPLRGSHLVFAQWRFPVAQAIAFAHPLDGRPVMIYPWEGVTLVGTTDVDHHESLSREPAITADEVAYLMAAVEAHFPRLGLGLEDVIATFAGVRPVIDTGQSDPSKESRDHVVWQEHGLLTVTGGKLTTFRLIALDALAAVRHIWPEMPEPVEDAPAFDPVQVELPRQLLPEVRRRLLGRYGAEVAEVVATAQSPAELEAIPHTPTLWAEVRWAARAEGVVHLEDLLLRRVRLGLLLPHGGAQWHDQLRGIVQGEVGWDDGRWQAEWAAYLARWRTYYSLPAWETIPNWRAWLAEKAAPPAVPEVVAEPSRTKAVAGVLLGAAVLSLASYWLLRRK